MTLLSTVYASAPIDEIILRTVSIAIAEVPALRIVNGFTDQMLGVEGTPMLFTACGFTPNLPSKNTSGQQTLSFTIGGINAEIQNYTMQALASRKPVMIVYREYLTSDKMNEAHRPYRMVMTGVSFALDTVTIEASYYDILNTKWPRLRYTSETAPGLLFMT